MRPGHAAGGSAFTASNSLSSASVTKGYGSQTVTGVTATPVQYNTNTAGDADTVAVPTPIGATVPLLEPPLKLRGTIQSYPWGCSETIYDLLGLTPGGTPAAELWLGAHPAAPAHVIGPAGDRALDRYLAEHPAALGGATQLPFLLKVLAAKAPLSLQVHPTRAWAEQRYAEEEAAGIPNGAPHRRYRDRNHKPELVVALSAFRALAGVRDPQRTMAVIAGFDTPALTEAYRLLAEDPAASGVFSTLAHLLTLPRADVGWLVAATVSAAARIAAKNGPDVAADPEAEDLRRAADPEAEDLRRAADLVGVLAAHHPGDIGIVAALLLNDVTLAPGEGLFQPAGMLHAYVSGVGIEAMAASDNVLRCALTTKHVDVPELLSVFNATPAAAPVLTVTDQPTVTWPVPVDDFTLHRVRAGGAPVPLPTVGPAIVLVTEGTLTLTSPAGDRTLTRGESAFLPSALPVIAHGSGDLYVAGCPKFGIPGHPPRLERTSRARWSSHDETARRPHLTIPTYHRTQHPARAHAQDSRRMP